MADSPLKCIREGAQKTIFDQLSTTFLSPQNFEASFNDESGTIVDIVFRDRESYRFRVLQPTSPINQNGNWITRECPGQFFTDEEEFRLGDFNTAQGRIQHWVNRILEDITISATSGKPWIDRLRANLEQSIDDLDNPEAPFSVEEAEEWEVRFAELIARMDELQEENKIHKEDLNRLKKHLKELRGKATTMPKRTWVRAVGNRIIDVFLNTAESALKAIAEGTVKGLLGPPQQ